MSYKKEFEDLVSGKSIQDFPGASPLDKIVNAFHDFCIEKYFYELKQVAFDALPCGNCKDSGMRGELEPGPLICDSCGWKTVAAQTVPFLRFFLFMVINNHDNTGCPSKLSYKRLEESIFIECAVCDHAKIKLTG